MRRLGFEPATSSLQGKCSNNWATIALRWALLLARPLCGVMCSTLYMTCNAELMTCIFIANSKWGPWVCFSITPGLILSFFNMPVCYQSCTIPGFRVGMSILSYLLFYDFIRLLWRSSSRTYSNWIGYSEILIIKCVKIKKCSVLPQT